jgi:hypothetical protein
MAKSGKLLRSLIRAGTRTAKLFAAMATPPAKPKPKPRRPRVKPLAAKSPTTSFTKPSAPRPAAKTRTPRTTATPTLRPSAVAPGKWLSAHVLRFADAGSVFSASLSSAMDSACCVG